MFWNNHAQKNIDIDRHTIHIITKYFSDKLGLTSIFAKYQEIGKNERKI